MPIIPEAPLTKVTLNLFASDVEWLKDRFPQGYTLEIRDVVNNYVTKEKLRYGSLKSQVFGEDL